MMISDIIKQVHTEDLAIFTLDELPGLTDEDFWVPELEAYAGLICLISSETWLMFRVDNSGYQDIPV